VQRRLQITHRTGYAYADVVEASFNEVRMTPLNADGQVLLSHHLEVSPNSTLHPYTDYWGAFVESFDVHVPHRRLEVTAISTVDTASEVSVGSAVSWEVMRSTRIADEYAEYLVPTHLADDASADPARAEIVLRMHSAPSPSAAANLAFTQTRDHIRYSPGTTTVDTTAKQAWSAGQGVCQDFTHACLSLLRAAGIPARYVSGYLHTEAPTPGQTVLGESHAWLDYWDGGWRSVDPTNDRRVGPAHVIVARGRDYSDVPPLKGIYAGGASEGLGVTVEITQI